MSNSPKGCPICGCTECGFAAFPVCWLCGYAQETDGRVVHPCGKSKEVVATLRALLVKANDEANKTFLNEICARLGEEWPK